MKEKLKIVHVNVDDLRPSEFNPRTWSASDAAQLAESIKKYGIVDPLLVNEAPERKNILIGGHMRLSVIKKLGIKEVPVVYLDIPDLERERELNIRLNKNTGAFDFNLLATLDESFLKDIGFSSEELDEIFGIDATPEEFDLDRELEKLDIKKIEAVKGDVYQLGTSRMMVGDSTVEADMLKLMGEKKADMVLCDPPYRLQYLQGKTRHGKSTTGFGAKKNRRYLETESLPANFTTLWMGNTAKVAAKDFSIIVYENWRNLREVWGEMEKYWKVRNMIVWHLPNRNQGYAGKHKLFSKHDIAMVGTSDDHAGIDLKEEDELLEEEYRAALFAISGKPHWEAYGKGNKYCPTDHIEFNAADEKSSGQGIIFGVKPLPILIPYIKVLTKRDDLILEPFGGSGSTLIAAVKLKRRCYLMEKSPVYAEVIKRRWERETGLKVEKIAYVGE